jgi:hypothetical protein
MKVSKSATFMKKPLIVMVLLAGTVSGYSQGQVNFSDYQGFLQQQVFNVQSSAPAGATAVFVTNGGYTTFEYQGSTAFANEMPQGSAVFAAGTALSGTGYDAQLFVSATAGASINQLTAAGGVLHFNTAAALLGLAKASILVTIPGLPVGSTGTYAFAAWNNDGGVDTTLAEAQAAGEPWGFSTTAFLIPGNPPVPIGAPAAGTTTPLASGLVEGFSLGVDEVPEPGTIALGLFGATAFLFRRRK